MKMPVLSDFPRSWSQCGIFASLLLLLGGMYVFPTRTVFHTQLYLFFFLPAIVFLLWQLVTRRIQLLRLDYLVLVFIGSYALSALYPDSIRDHKHALYVATLVVAYLGVSRLALLQGVHMLALIRTLVVIVAISCLLQIYLYYSPSDKTLVWRLCCVLSVKNPLLEAQAIGFYIALAVFCTLSGVGAQRWMFAACALALCGFGFLTYSRSFFIATVFLAGWYGLIRIRTIPQLLVLLGVSAALVAALGLFVLSDRGYSRFDIWSEAIKLIMQKPLLGYGGGYGLDIRILYQGDPTHWISQMHWRDPHNIFLMLWLRYGVASLLAFCVLLVALLRYGLQHRADKLLQALCAALLFGVVSLCFEGGDIFGKVNTKWPALWFPIILIIYRLHANKGSHENSASGL
jgi:O-antigen ligase